MEGLMTKFLKLHISYSDILQECTKESFRVMLLVDGVWHIFILTSYYPPFT